MSTATVVLRLYIKRIPPLSLSPSRQINFTSICPWFINIYLYVFHYIVSLVIWVRICNLLACICCCFHIKLIRLPACVCVCVDQMVYSPLVNYFHNFPIDSDVALRAIEPVVGNRNPLHTWYLPVIDFFQTNAVAMHFCFIKVREMLQRQDVSRDDGVINLQTTAATAGETSSLCLIL